MFVDYHSQLNATEEVLNAAFIFLGMPYYTKRLSSTGACSTVLVTDLK